MNPLFMLFKKDNIVMKINVWGVLGLLPPFFLYIFLSPIIFSFGVSIHFFTFPMYLGLMTWPAYIFVLFADNYKGLSLVKCWWIRISLIIEILCGIYGVFIGYMLPFLSPLSLLITLICLGLLIRFEKQRNILDKS